MIETPQQQLQLELSRRGSQQAVYSVVVVVAVCGPTPCDQRVRRWWVLAGHHHVTGRVSLQAEGGDLRVMSKQILAPRSSYGIVLHSFEVPLQLIPALSSPHRTMEVRTNRMFFPRLPAPAIITLLYCVILAARALRAQLNRCLRRVWSPGSHARN